MPLGIEKIPQIAKGLGRTLTGAHKIRPRMAPTTMMGGKTVSLTTKAIRPVNRTLHNFFDRFGARWPGSVDAKTGKNIPVVFNEITGLPTNPPRMPSGELVGIPFRNFGDDMADMLTVGVTKTQDWYKAVVNPVNAQGKRVSKLIGNDGFDIVIKNAGGQRGSDYVKLIGKHRTQPQVLAQIKQFEGVYNESLDPLRNYLKSSGLPYYQKGRYVPESCGEA